MSGRSLRECIRRECEMFFRSGPIIQVVKLSFSSTSLRAAWACSHRYRNVWLLVIQRYCYIWQSDHISSPSLHYSLSLSQLSLAITGPFTIFKLRMQSYIVPSKLHIECTHLPHESSFSSPRTRRCQVASGMGSMTRASDGELRKRAGTYLNFCLSCSIYHIIEATSLLNRHVSPWHAVLVSHTKVFTPTFPNTEEIEPKTFHPCYGEQDSYELHNHFISSFSILRITGLRWNNFPYAYTTIIPSCR